MRSPTTTEAPDVTGSRLCLAIVVGLSAFWQLFRFTGYNVAYTLISSDTFSAEVVYSMGLAVSVFFFACLVTRHKRTSATLPTALPIVGAFPTAALVGGWCLHTLHGAPFASTCAMAGFILCSAAAIAALTWGWIQVLTTQGLVSIRLVLICTAASAVLNFFYASFDQALSGNSIVISISSPVVASLCLGIAGRLIRPCKSHETPVRTALGHATHIPPSRSIILLVIASAILFVLALSSSGSVNAGDLDPTGKETITLRHLVTMGQILLLIAFALGCSTIRKALYLGWAVFALFFLAGLLLIRSINPDTLAFGVALVSAGGRSFELLLFMLVVLELIVAQQRTWVPMVLFLLPEALAGTMSRLALPTLYARFDWSFANYVEPLSLVLAASFVVCMTFYLVLELVRRPSTDDPFAFLLVKTPSAANAVDSLEAGVQVIADHYALSAREASVAHLIARGYSADRIATQEGLSINTVRTHTKNLYRKLGIHSRQELIALVETAPRTHQQA